ncbi:hypothetical protein [Hoeflea sp. IMCC20628]|uniref:hypothetical protein n=1 Tax=Hoeflea sp. IMCC20628 TaxID=1620421 RepID=UPI00063ACA0D|nr:hypothetical protein [Hoeflea sp. IMCC20628]
MIERAADTICAGSTAGVDVSTRTASILRLADATTHDDPEYDQCTLRRVGIGAAQGPCKVAELVMRFADVTLGLTEAAYPRSWLWQLNSLSALDLARDTEALGLWATEFSHPQTPPLAKGMDVNF